MNGAKIFSIYRSAGWFKNKQANKQKNLGSSHMTLIPINTLKPKKHVTLARYTHVVVTKIHPQETLLPR